MMRIDFPQGVPNGCVEWLNQHVGQGKHLPWCYREPKLEECAWYYERRFRPWDKQIKDWHKPQGDYITSITVKDPAKATWFVLQWGGQ